MNDWNDYDSAIAGIDCFWTITAIVTIVTIKWTPGFKVSSYKNALKGLCNKESISGVSQSKQHYNKYNYVIEVINSKNKLLLAIVFEKLPAMTFLSL